MQIVNRSLRWRPATACRRSISIAIFQNRAASSLMVLRSEQFRLAAGYICGDRGHGLDVQAGRMSRYRQDWNFGAPTGRGARDREQAARHRLHQEGLPASLLGRLEMRDSYCHMKPADIPVEQPTKFDL